MIALLNRPDIVLDACRQIIGAAEDSGKRRAVKDRYPRTEWLIAARKWKAAMSKALSVKYVAGGAASLHSVDFPSGNPTGIARALQLLAQVPAQGPNGQLLPGARALKRLAFSEDDWNLRGGDFEKQIEAEHALQTRAEQLAHIVLSDGLVLDRLEGRQIGWFFYLLYRFRMSDAIARVFVNAARSFVLEARVNLPVQRSFLRVSEALGRVLGAVQVGEFLNLLDTAEAAKRKREMYGQIARYAANVIGVASGPFGGVGAFITTEKMDSAVTSLSKIDKERLWRDVGGSWGETVRSVVERLLPERRQEREVHIELLLALQNGRKEVWIDLEGMPQDQRLFY